MSNYVDTVQLQNGTDYPIRVPNGVTYRNPSGMTPSQNPLLRRNDLVQTLSNDEDNPPSSKAVKTVTDGLSSDLASVTPTVYSTDVNNFGISTAWGSLFYGNTSISTNKDWRGKKIVLSFVPGGGGTTAFPVVDQVEGTKIWVMLVRPLSASVTGTIYAFCYE